MVNLHRMAVFALAAGLRVAGATQKDSVQPADVSLGLRINGRIQQVSIDYQALQVQFALYRLMKSRARLIAMCSSTPETLRVGTKHHRRYVAPAQMCVHCTADARKLLVERWEAINNASVTKGGPAPPETVLPEYQQFAVLGSNTIVRLCRLRVLVICVH